MKQEALEFKAEPRRRAKLMPSELALKDAGEASPAMVEARVEFTQELARNASLMGTSWKAAAMTRDPYPTRTAWLSCRETSPSMTGWFEVNSRGFHTEYDRLWYDKSLDSWQLPSGSYLPSDQTFLCWRGLASPAEEGYTYSVAGARRARVALQA